MTDISYNTLSTATTVGTGNSTDGAGNFDNLMKVVTLHLEAQFAAGRITGTDYATVYLGALQSTLAQAVSFTLSMNKANEEATLLEKQQSKVNADTLLVDATKLKVVAEETLLGKKSTTEDKQIAVMTQQIALFVQQAKGFKWNADAKYLKTVLDAYAVNLSVSKSYDASTQPAVGGHQTGTAALDASSKAGDYVVKLKPTST
jgi:hypothetical protein|tara:strand:+ start:1004 stop:1612 length:609 start_codon:yes stop_codon:yes gene_type:complete